MCIWHVCVTSGFVHGWSAAVPSASAGVCRSYDREGTPTQTAFRRTGYTTGGLNTRVCVYTCIHTPHSRTSAYTVACLMSTRRYTCKNSDVYTHSCSVKQLSVSDVIKDGHGAILGLYVYCFIFTEIHQLCVLVTDTVNKCLFSVVLCAVCLFMHKSLDCMQFILRLKACVS